MNLFELFVKIGVDDQASNKLKDLGGKLGNGLKTAAKIGTAAVTTAAAGIAALTTAAVKNYAEYEQLVGGVDTLFKDASKKVQQYAADAYKTAGMSANDYMANATAFSASLISSLGGDTEKAAEYANRAMVSMSDNANKMGTSLDSIVQTYQSLSRGNMAMLDNLKLGYGGTKAELERLIADAASYTDIQKEMGVTVDASSMSFDNIVNAIAVVQGKLGIAGATALEAGTTIEGSVNSMKAAWSNLITGIANDNADFEGLINNFVTTIVGDGSDKNLGVFGNILPRIEVALDGAVKLIEGLFPKIIEALPNLIGTLLPSIVNGALNIVQSFVTAISDNGDLLVQSAIDAVVTLTNGILKMLPEISKLGMDLIVSLGTGLAENLDELIPTVASVIAEIANTLTNLDNVRPITLAAIELILVLIEGIAEALPTLIDAILFVGENITATLIDPEILAKLVNAALRIVIALAGGIIASIPRLLMSVTDLILAVIYNFAQTDWGKVGKNIVDGLLDGLKKAWGSLKKWFTNAWDKLVGSVKVILGIHSPSRVFAGIGKNMALGVGEGWEDTFGDVQDEIDSSMDFGEADYGITTSSTSIGDFGGSSSAYGYGGSQNVNVTVSIDDSANAMGLARALLPFLKIAEKEVYA